VASRRQNAVTVGRVAGVPVRLHVTLFLVLPVLAVLFGLQFVALADQHPGDNVLPPALWGAVIALALFASVFVHELAHTLVARAIGARVRSITLLFIGGMSELEERVLPPGREAVIALAGPLLSIVLGAALFALRGAAEGAAPDVRLGVGYLAVLNLALGAFNLAPAFPLDGGRVLRAALTPRLGRQRATRAAALVGKALALVLAFIALRYGDVLALLVAGFVWLGAERENQMVSLDEALGDLRVGDVLEAAAGGAVTLPVHLGLGEAAERLLAARSPRAALVTPLGDVVGAITADALQRMAGRLGARGRASARLGDLRGATAAPVRASDPARTALARMNETGAAALAVVDEGPGPSQGLVGVLTRSALERYAALRALAAPPRRGAKPTTTTDDADRRGFQTYVNQSG
jgi:Zn-dependent protease